MGAKISILIITFNRPIDTIALLENIKSQNELTKHVGEILLLNNDSTIPYAEVEVFIEQNPGLPIRYFNHDENLGVAKGRNFLIQRAEFPYLLVLDDDVVFADTDAIVNIASLFSKKQYIEHNTAVITLNIFYHETKVRQQTALPHKQYEEYKEKEWFLTSYFVGAAHLMKKELFEKTGLYPEDFFYGMEEYDLSYRIIDAGYTLAYDNTVKVYHKESPTGRVPNKTKLAMMWYNKCVVAYKYLPTKYFYTTGFLWIFEYLRKTKFDVAGAFKSYRKTFQIPRKVKKQRISKQSLSYLEEVKARCWY